MKPSFTHPLCARLSDPGTLFLLPGLLHHLHLRTKQPEKERGKGMAEVSFRPEVLETSGCLVPLLPPLIAHHLELRPEKKTLVFNTEARRRKKRPNIDK